jgi:hypothetical protein
MAFPGGLAGQTPTTISNYDPAKDLLLSPKFNAVQRGYFRNDPTFPARPVI